MKLEYKQEDCQAVVILDGTPRGVMTVMTIAHANALLPEIKKAWLAELVKDAPKVYSDYQNGIWTEEIEDGHLRTHTARLVDIEEIGK